MACVVSFGFSQHLFPSQTLDKEINPRKSAFGGFFRPATSKTAMKLLAPNCLNRGRPFADRSCYHHIAKLYRHYCGSVSHYSYASFSSHSILLGFWVGPDVEDGWGFVEAFADQIV